MRFTARKSYHGFCGLDVVDLKRRRLHWLDGVEKSSFSGASKFGHLGQ